MSETPKGKSRDDRRAKALRENLKRRRAQARGRVKTEHVENPVPGRDSSNNSNEPDSPNKE